MLNLKMIGQRISDKRRVKNLSQLELADALYVTRQAVSKWEIGQSIPSVDILVKLTDILDISIDDLLDCTDITNHAYHDMLSSYPRASVISQFCRADNPNQHIKDIFYLLTPKERKLIINQMLKQQINIDVSSLWPYASVNERKYIIRRLIADNKKEELTRLYPLMTYEEQLIMSFQRKQFKVIYRSNNNSKKEVDNK